MLKCFFHLYILTMSISKSQQMWQNCLLQYFWAWTYIVMQWVKLLPVMLASSIKAMLQVLEALFFIRQNPCYSIWKSSE